MNSSMVFKQTRLTAIDGSVELEVERPTNAFGAIGVITPDCRGALRRQVSQAELSPELWSRRCAVLSLASSLRGGREGPMSRRCHTPEQIIRKLADGQKLLGGGMPLRGVCREFSIAESVWARWLSQHGGMKADDAKRLKELEGENTRLKKHAELGESHSQGGRRRETSGPEPATGCLWMA